MKQSAVTDTARTQKHCVKYCRFILAGKTTVTVDVTRIRNLMSIRSRYRPQLKSREVADKEETRLDVRQADHCQQQSGNKYTLYAVTEILSTPKITAN